MKFSICRNFSLDVSYLYGKDWTISEREMDDFAEDIDRAAGAVDHIRRTGEGPRKGTSVLFPHLPYILEEKRLISEEELEGLSRLGKLASSGKIDAVISVGIGGSYLGNQALFDACCGPYWNMAGEEERRHFPKVFFAGQTADPESLHSLLTFLQGEKNKKKGPYRVLVLVISKSGTTIEPSGALSVLRRALPAMGCKTFFAAVTDRRKGKLLTSCVTEGWIHFAVPEGIGGRFSVFSQVGLVFGVLCGIDLKAFLQGARDVEEACRKKDWRENPALALAAMKYIAVQNHGICAEVTMPYGDRLRSLGWWYAQLLGESLGKKETLKGEIVHAGRIPVSAVGTTDMHSLTQEQQEGAPNKLLQFISVAHTAADLNFHLEEMGKPCTVPMSYVMGAALSANAQALASEKRMSCELCIGEVNEYYLGALMYFFFLAIAYEGALWGIDAYDQPGVEAYKKILHKDLAGYGRK